MASTIHTGDARDVLAAMPDQSVQMCVTSPPYFGLRDYNVNGQIGLEATVDDYVQNLVAVFREVRRVLKDDGTLWLNLGDSYAAGGTIGRNDTSPEALARRAEKYGTGQKAGSFVGSHGTRPPVAGLKPKDLIGIPWRVAFALQSDGWTLRQDIIWAKPNPMPESVKDRCTKSHEYLFLLSKSPRYYYDAAAIAEPNAVNPNWNYGSEKYRDDITQDAYKVDGDNRNRKSGGKGWSGFAPAGPDGNGRNKRSVWTVATQPFSEAHFATFPPKLIEPCILAGSSEKGHCPECGQSWVRVVERESGYNGAGRSTDTYTAKAYATPQSAPRGPKSNFGPGGGGTTVGWEPQCTCGASPVPDVVLDPFGGAGTTGLVADRLSRDSVLIDLNPEYAEIARRRIVSDAPLFANVEVS